MAESLEPVAVRLNGKGEIRLLIRCLKREIFLDYLGRPSAITRLLRNRRRTQKGEPERWQLTEDSAQSC